jgi:acetyl esterase/lipase
MEKILLWPEGAPGALGANAQDQPCLDVYEPFGNAFTDAAVLILPGGGYAHLAPHEGEGYAGMFQLWGFKTFVCNYRLSTHGYRHPAMLHDAARAVRTVRSLAGKMSFHPHKIVLVGSSAGGHLAAILMAKWTNGRANDSDPIEQVSSRPDYAVLAYPGITMGEHAHGGTRASLMGESPSPELVHELSAEHHLRADSPPCFIWHTVQDPVVPVRNTLLFAEALHNAGVPFESHVYEYGWHGLGMKDGQPWVDDMFRWLRRKLAS